MSTSNLRGYLTARVQPPGTGVIRIVWTSDRGVRLDSRTVSVTGK